MTSIVIDCNVSMMAVYANPLKENFDRQWEKWLIAKTNLCAPTFWLNEITSALHKIYMRGMIDEKRAKNALEAAFALGIELVNEDPELCRKAFEWATRLSQLPAYDCFYLALAEQLGSDFWTADERLANRAHQLGANWVHWIGEA